MKIYFIRHGETEWNRLEKIQGRIDNQLNERGILQAQKAKEILGNIPFTHVYASTLSRAIDTAKTITKEHQLPIVEDARLLEREFGELEGQAHEAYYAYQSEAEMPKSVEQKSEVYSRVNDFFEKRIKQHGIDDIILISAHAHTIRSWAEKMFPKDFLFSTRLYNCQGIMIDYDGNQFTFVGITDKVEVEE